MIEADEDQLKLLRVKVKSLGRARVFLKAEGLLGLDTEREIALDRNRVAERVPCQPRISKTSRAYLQTKKSKMGHLLEGL